MSNPIESNATKTERIAAALGASDTFMSALGTAGGNTTFSAAEQPADAAQGAEPAAAEQLPGDAAPTAQEAAQRHVVAGVGNTPQHIAAPQQTPYDQLAKLLGHPTRS